MLPVYIKVFDEKLLFAQGMAEEAQSIKLYTVFTGQTALYFSLLEGDERRKTWYRIILPSGSVEDDLFAEIEFSCVNGEVAVVLAGGGGTLQRVGDAGAELARLFQAADYPSVLGVDRAVKDPEVLERACETQKLVFSDEKEIQALCDNAEHRLTVKSKPPAPAVPIRPASPARSPEASGERQRRGAPGLAYRAAFAAAHLAAVSIAALLVLAAIVCLIVMFYLYETGGRPTIVIAPAQGAFSLLLARWL